MESQNSIPRAAVGEKAISFREADVSVDAEAKVYTFVASDETVDRYGDVIDAKGWDVRNFRANPVILFGHDASALPVGKAERVFVDGGKLKIAVKFAPPEANPEAEKVRLLVDGGFLRATSVGFRPLEAEPMKDSGGLRFTKSELLEVSIVTVPANPSALIEARAAGLDVDFLARHAEATLAKLRGPGVWRAVEEPAPVEPAPVAPPAPAPAPAKAAPAPAPKVLEVPKIEISEKKIAEMVRTAITKARAKHEDALIAATGRLP